MSTARSSQDEVLDLIGEVIAGLAVPYSLSMEATRSRPKVHLGTAARAWVELRDALRLFGWSRPEEVVTALRRLLGLGQMPQRQDSLTDQFRDLIPVANRLGCHDAANVLRANVEQHRAFNEAARRLLGDDAPIEISDDEAYNGQREPQRRELKARERDVLVRILTQVLHDPDYRHEELDTLTVIRGVINPRRPDEE